MLKEEIINLLETKLDSLLEAKFKRVIRSGKIIRKRVSRKGFKLVRRAGGKISMKRMSPQEKRNRHIALMRAWKKGKASRVIKSQRKVKRSMLKRKAIFGANGK